MVGPTNWNLGASGDQQFANIAFDYEGDHRGLAISRLPGFLRIQPRVQHLMRSMAGGVQATRRVNRWDASNAGQPSATGTLNDQLAALPAQQPGAALRAQTGHAARGLASRLRSAWPTQAATRRSPRFEARISRIQ